VKSSRRCVSNESGSSDFSRFNTSSGCNSVTLIVISLNIFGMLGENDCRFIERKNCALLGRFCIFSTFLACTWNSQSTRAFVTTIAIVDDGQRRIIGSSSSSVSKHFSHNVIVTFMHRRRRGRSSSRCFLINGNGLSDIIGFSSYSGCNTATVRVTSMNITLHVIAMTSF